MILHTSWSWSVYFNRQRGDSMQRGVCMYVCMCKYFHTWMDGCMSGGQKSQAVLWSCPYGYVGALCIQHASLLIWSSCTKLARCLLYVKHVMTSLRGTLWHPPPLFMLLFGRSLHNSNLSLLLLLLSTLAVCLLHWSFRWRLLLSLDYLAYLPAS